VKAIKKRSFRHLSFLASHLLIFFLVVPCAMAGLTDQVTETVLPNGLKVILLENHKAPLVTFQVWYRVGSRNETPGKTGLSHMLEHMMFKGTRKVGPEKFSRIIQENGGNDNAFTSYDYTAYYENLRSDRIQVAIDLEEDRMRNLVLREKDFRTERKVVMEERRQRTEDNPQACLWERMEAAAFKVSPYRWPIIGWMEDMERWTLADLKAYYRTYYSPANAFLVVAGDFRKEELLPRVEKAFGAQPGGVRPDPARAQEPFWTEEQRIVVRKEAQLPFLVKGYRVPNLHHPDAYVLEVIAAVLAGGKSSRFYEGLVRGRRIALEADADNSLLSYDPRLFYLSAVPMPGHDTAELEKALDDEIARLRTEPVKEEELQRARNQIEAAFVFGQDALFSQAALLARHEIVGSWKKLDEYLPAIRKVTAADIRRVAGRYLVRENSAVGILIPQGSKDSRGQGVE